MAYVAVQMLNGLPEDVVGPFPTEEDVMFWIGPSDHDDTWYIRKLEEPS
jgi:hypothetical protein